MHRSFKYVVGNGADFSPHTRSSCKMSQFTSYLKLLLLPEVKYKERLLPVGEKKLCVWQCLAH